MYKFILSKWNWFFACLKSRRGTLLFAEDKIYFSFSIKTIECVQNLEIPRFLFEK